MPLFCLWYYIICYEYPIHLTLSDTLELVTTQWPDIEYAYFLLQGVSVDFSLILFPVGFTYYQNTVEYRFPTILLTKTTTTSWIWYLPVSTLTTIIKSKHTTVTVLPKLLGVILLEPLALFSNPNHWMPWIVSKPYLQQFLKRNL